MPVTDEAVKVVGTAVGTFSDKPLVFALILMNVALLVMFYFLVTGQQNADAAERKLMYESQKETQMLLANCVIPK